MRRGCGEDERRCACRWQRLKNKNDAKGSGAEAASSSVEQAEEEAATSRGQEGPTRGSTPATGPKAPGMKYRHYSPRAPVRVVEGVDVFVAAIADELGRRQGGGGCEGGGGGRGLGIMAPEDVLRRVRDTFEAGLGEHGVNTGKQGGRGSAEDVGEGISVYEDGDIVQVGAFKGCVLVRCGDVEEDADSIARDLFRALRSVPAASEWSKVEWVRAQTGACVCVYVLHVF